MDTFEEMRDKDEQQRQEIADLLLKKRAMEEEKERIEAVFRELEQRHADTERRLETTRSQLEQTELTLEETKQQREEQQHLVEVHADTEQRLAEQAERLIATADLAASDAHCLRDTVDRRSNLEQTNREAVNAYRSASSARRDSMLSTLQSCSEQYHAARDTLQANIDDQARDNAMTSEMNIQDMKLLAAKMTMFANEINSLAGATCNDLEDKSAKSQSELVALANQRVSSLKKVLGEFVRTVAARVHTEQWLTGATSRVNSLQSTQSSFSSQAKKIESERDSAMRRRYAALLSALQRKETQITACIEQIEKDKLAMEASMAKQLAHIQEMADQVVAIRQAVNARIACHVEQINQMYEESTAWQLERRRAELEAVRHEMQAAREELEECAGEGKAAAENVQHYVTQLGEGISAITAAMEAFSQSLAQVDHTHSAGHGAQGHTRHC